MTGNVTKHHHLGGSSRQTDARQAVRGTAERLVIVGNGMVGFRLLEEMEQVGELTSWDVTVFGAEPHPALDRVNLTDYLRGRDARDLELAGRDWYATRDIKLHTDDPVILVDRDEKIVHSRSGRVTRYDRLVFATGSRAFLPEIPGRDLEGVFVYRDLADLKRIAARVERGDLVLVIGGGLLGLEAAEAFHELGLNTHVVERGSGLMSKQLDPGASRELQRQIESRGITVHNALEVSGVFSRGDDLVAEFKNGTCIKARTVVFATGIRPRDELATACGLATGPRGGIKVNDQLQTSDPGIYAIGECAAHDGTVYGLVLPGYEMAGVLARHLAGRPAGFAPADQSAILKLEGIEVAAVGQYQADCPSFTSAGKGVYRRISVRRGRVVGAIGVGEWPEQALLRDAIKRKRRVWPWNINRFIAHGRLWNPTRTADVGSWPETAEVCNCMSVQKREIVAACAGGCGTMEALSRSTGAGTVCGSCRPLLAQLAGAKAGILQPLAGRRLLWLGVIATMVLIGLIAAFEIPFSTSVTGGWQPERLWTNPFIKQVTGFTLVGLSLLGMALSLRKRLRRFAWGDYGYWRAVHTVLGAVTLVVLVSHTGLRLGANLNLVLMMNFLALALTGALAGAVTALESRLQGDAAIWLRRSWIVLHILLVWPLPALVFFHAFASFYY